MKPTLRVALLVLSVTFCACQDRSQTDSTPATTDRASPSNAQVSLGNDTIESGTMTEKIVKTEAEWRAILNPEQYHIAREKGTERAFSGEYWQTKTPGIYQCAACGLPLFESKTKFDSGTGWPSFWQPIDKRNVLEKTDIAYGMVRTEVLCNRCESHLGHVFEDGPQPTGLRYCMNSASLKLVTEVQPETQ